MDWIYTHGWVIVVIAVVVATAVAVLVELVHEERERKAADWVVIEAMSGIDDEYKRLLESA